MERSYINILIMPTDLCNMHCVYCFHEPYHDSALRIEMKTLRRLYETAARDFKTVNLIWHGGEPLIMGKDFYREALTAQREYPAVRFRNSMQSNLTMLTEDIADLLKQYHVGVGSSFDGVMNEELRGNSEVILRKRQLLLDRGMTCGFIMVVSRKNIDTLIESYELFKKMQAGYTINLYVPTNSDNNKELALDPLHTAERIIEFFEHWYRDQECRIHVTYFERIVKYMLTGRKTLCKCTSCLGKWVGVRYNGEITPCNRYFPEECSYGNVWDYEHLREAFESEGYARLLQKAVRRREKCASCELYGFCEGGCNNVALNENGIENNGGDSCMILKTVWRHISDRLKVFDPSDRSVNPQIAAIVRRRKNTESHSDMHTDIAYHIFTEDRKGEDVDD